MKALAAMEKGKLALVDVAIPEPDDYEVLVKTRVAYFAIRRIK